MIVTLQSVCSTDHQDGEKSKGKYSHVRTLSSPLHLNKAKLNTTQNNNTSSSGLRWLCMLESLACGFVLQAGINIL